MKLKESGQRRPRQDGASVRCKPVVKSIMPAPLSVGTITPLIRKAARWKLAGACHEAGHAIVSRHLGQPVREASYEVGESKGEAKGQVMVPPCGIFELWVNVAGCVAELLALGQKDNGYIRFCAISDGARLHQQLSQYLEKWQIRAYRRKLENDVAEFLYQPAIWKCVCRFAEELLRSGWLGAKDCTRLTDDVPKANLAEVRRTMLNPTFHNRIGPRFGRKQLLAQKQWVREAVERLPSAFHIRPSLEVVMDWLDDGDYSSDEKKKLLSDVYAFWLQPSWSKKPREA